MGLSLRMQVIGLWSLVTISMETNGKYLIKKTF